MGLRNHHRTAGSTLLIMGITAAVLSGTGCSHRYEVHVLHADTQASFRGLSIANDRVAWIGGSNGTYGRTTDAGSTWTIDSLEGYSGFGFRSVYAFDEMTAVMANAGSPARILRTDNGGKEWKVVYDNSDTAAFIDGVDFWDETNGMMYGDPIRGRMLLVGTSDGGRTWVEVPEQNRPRLQEGEYSFAASGTGIRCYADQTLVISTGGVVSRLWISDDRGRTWHVHETPILQGKPTTGIYSFTFLTEEQAIIVGGDYLRDTLTVDHVFFSPDGGSDWKAPGVPTRGYRECVEVLSGNTVVATGPTGTDISYDGGEHWMGLSDETGFHVVRCSPDGSLVLMAGNAGSIAIVK